MNRQFSTERRRWLANSGHPRPRIGISLTPLIDVVFILLVFFMLASSFLDWRAIALRVPGVAETAGAAAESILVEVRPGELRLAGERFPLDALTARLAQEAADRPRLRVLVKPAAGVDLQGVVAVVDRLDAAGVANVLLVRDARQ